MKGVVVEPVRIDSCGAPITILEDQLDLDNTLYLFPLVTLCIGRAVKRIKMVNESMSLGELTGRAYARGLPAVKVRLLLCHEVGFS
jgi:hypothetical protein